MQRGTHVRVDEGPGLLGLFGGEKRRIIDEEHDAHSASSSFATWAIESAVVERSSTPPSVPFLRPSNERSAQCSPRRARCADLLIVRRRSGCLIPNSAAGVRPRQLLGPENVHAGH